MHNLLVSHIDAISIMATMVTVGAVYLGVSWSQRPAPIHHDLVDQQLYFIWSPITGRFFSETADKMWVDGIDNATAYPTVRDASDIVSVGEQIVAVNKSCRI
jgi:hypothetical protein